MKEISKAIARAIGRLGTDELLLVMIFGAPFVVLAIYVVCLAATGGLK